MLALTLLAALAAAPAQPSYAPKDRPYDVGHYKIEFTLGEDGAFTNKVSITLKAKRALTEVEFDAEKLNVTEALLGEAKAQFFVKGNTLTVKPPRALAAGKDETIVVTVSGKATVEQSGFFVTHNPDDPDGPPYYFTHFETEGARRFYPCNDQPFDKATSEVFAVVPAEYQVLSNGKLEKDEAFSQGGVNLRRVHWVQEEPHSSYLVALAVGKFEDVDVGASLPATLHILPGSSDRAFVARDATLAHLSYEASALGVKYPWAKFDQVTVPTFFWGGMENTSLVTVRESYLVLPHRNYIWGRPRTIGLIAHEMAHQWFGDDVTLKWWDDAWLNEGFATWLGQNATEKYLETDLVPVERATSTQINYFRQEDGPRSHALKAKGLEFSQLFDDTSYTKGAMVLRMLETWLGKDEFKKGIKAYLDQYAQKNAASEDFFAAMGKSSKKDKDVKAFQQSWVTQRGYPVISPSFTWSEGTLTVTIRQRPNHAEDKSSFVFKLPLGFHRTSEPSYSKEDVIVVDKPVVTAKFQLPAPPQWVNWNKGANALAKIEPSALGEDAWVLGARGDDDPTWRLLSQYALMTNFIDPTVAELNKPSDAAMNAILDGLSSDPSPYVREEMLNQLGSSKWPKLPSEFGPVVLGLAKRPEKLPEDSLGNIRVRAAALALLGRIDFADGRKYVISQLQKQDLDPNFVRACAIGVARIGDSVALAELGAGIHNNKARGTFFWKSAAEGLGAYPSADVIPEIRSFLKDAKGNNDAARIIPSMLNENWNLKSLPETVAMIKDVSLDEGWDDEYRTRMLGVLDQVKTPEAKAALTDIAAKSQNEKVKGQAERVLAANFPAPPPEKKGPVKKK